IKQFGPTAANQTLGQWLAATVPNMFGGGNAAPNLSGFTNAQVAMHFASLFLLPDPYKMAAEVMATALNVYATTTSLGGMAGQNFGFMVNANGLGAYNFNIGFSGAAFGVPNNTVLNVYQVLQK